MTMRLQEDALKRNEPISVNMPRLASWTKDRRTAEEYATDGEALIVVGKRNLKPILDIERFIKFFPDEIDDEGLPFDFLRDAAREAEVVCEHDEPLSITPKEAKII